MGGMEQVSERLYEGNRRHNEGDRDRKLGWGVRGGQDKTERDGQGLNTVFCANGLLSLFLFIP